MFKSRIELIFGHKLGIFFRFHMLYFIWVSLIYKNRYDRLYLVHCIQNPYFAHFLVGIFETKLLALHMLHVYENLSMLLKRINLNACTFLLIRLASFLVRLIISGTALVHISCTIAWYNFTSLEWEKKPTHGQRLQQTNQCPLWSMGRHL